MNKVGRSRENNFNFLRFLFALLVLLSHAFELVDGNRRRELLTRMFQTISFGELAVDGFFLLSGYLIVQSWHNNPEALQFLTKRIRRIYPGFIVASLIAAFVVGPLAAAPQNYFAAFWPAGFIKSLILLRMPEVPTVFVGSAYPVVNGSMWTIALEFQCYLGVLCIGLLGGIRRRAIWATLTLFTLVALLCLKFNFGGNLIDLKSSKELLRLSSFFLVGGFYYLFRDLFTSSRLGMSGATALLVVSMFSINMAEVSLAILGGYLLFCFAFAEIGALAKFGTLPDVSYGVYLYGWPVQKMLLWYFPTMSPWLLFPLSCFVCVTLGWLSWVFVEKRFMFSKKDLHQIGFVPAA